MMETKTFADQRDRRVTLSEKYEAQLDFVGGWFAGMAGTAAGHPLDTIKVRLQTEQVAFATSSNATKNAPMFRTWTGLVTTFHTEGMSGLYKGLLSPILGQAFINAIIFGVKNNVYRSLGEENQNTLRGHMIAGSAAGFAQSFAACPIELGKVRVQLQGQGVSAQKYRASNSKGSIASIYQIFKHEGIQGCYRGMSTTVVRDITGFSIYFGVFEWLCMRRKEMKKIEEVELSHLLLFGGSAGVSSWIISHPIDLIKSRLQADGIKGKNKYKGTIDCLKKSIKNEGGRVFLKGMFANLSRAFVVNACIFPCEEYFRRWHKKTLV
ncbi:mitochondrial basic amino acids transporter-like isoform X2 [Glandiceps talaboti]